MENAIELGRNSWAYQELFKGRLLRWPDTDSVYGGWGINRVDYPDFSFNPNEIESSELKVRPYFKKDTFKDWLYTDYAVEENILNFRPLLWLQGGKE